MLVEIYIWSWIHLHPTHVRKKLARFLVLSAVILLPLLALNLTMVKRGFMPQKPSPEINLSQTHYPGDIPEE